MIKNIFYLFAISLLLSCKTDSPSETVVYNNNFESNDLTHISGGVIEQYNGSKVLGRYNKGSFKLTLDGLPKHALVEVSFDLFIHDSWDGNKTGDSGRNGPDIWKFVIDGSEFINTTFSNSDCGTSTFCDPQSYPANYPNNNNNPKTGAFNKNLPGVCLNANQIGGTALYKISKTINHSNSSIVIECLDELVQTNTADPKCDESWSVDNLKVKVIAL